MSQTKRNLLIDTGVLVLFLVTLNPSLTGLAIHEWLSVGLGGVLLTHVLLHWQWVVETTRRLFGRLASQARFNYLLNLLLLGAFTLVIGSGIMVSEEMLPFLGFRMASGGFWSTLHHLSAEWIIWIAGLHVAVHWKWIVNAVRRYAIAPLRRKKVAVVSG